MKTGEIRALASRVKDLRQELESVEARLRELSDDGAALAPIETVDSPTVLTTNHAQRRARAERVVPFVAAFGAVIVLGAGIGIGYALRPPLPVVLSAPPVPVAEPTAAPSEPAPSSRATASPAVDEATAAAAPSASISPAPTVSVVPARPVAPARNARLDRGF
jgi:hypothetical protein